MFYNDNKASFQQFVDMMRNERDRQCQEDMQILSEIKCKEMKKSTGTESHTEQQLTDCDFQNSLDTVTVEDSLTRDGMTIGGEYQNSQDHGALRFVFSHTYKLFKYLFITVHLYYEILLLNNRCK